MSASASVRAREEGNRLYKSAANVLAPVLQKSRLQDALRAYNKALSLAANQQEKAAANKNLGLCSEKLANILEVTGEPSRLVLHYFQEGLRHFNEALAHGWGNSGDWVEGVRQLSRRCWTELRDRLEDLEVEERMKALHANVQLILDTEARGQALMEIAFYYCHVGLVAFSKKDFKGSLQNLHNTFHPIREAASLGVEDAPALEEDIHVQICVAESLQARVTGDDLLAMVIQDGEIKNINMVWDVIDWYKQAILLTRERDIEMEAVACSRLGKVYDQVLKLKARAKAYLIHCVELAHTLVPRNIYGEEWYITATTILARYQAEAVRAEEERKQKGFAEVLGKIKHLLDPIDKMQKECLNSIENTRLQQIAFVKYLYKEHPPKNPNHVLKMDDESKVSPQDLKKIFQKAVIHYHPDKVNEEEDGKEWKVLTEEICKRLVAIYEKYKSVSVKH